MGSMLTAALLVSALVAMDSKSYIGNISSPLITTLDSLENLQWLSNWELSRALVKLEFYWDELPWRTQRGRKWDNTAQGFILFISVFWDYIKTSWCMASLLLRTQLSFYKAQYDNALIWLPSMSSDGWGWGLWPVHLRGSTFTIF